MSNRMKPIPVSAAKSMADEFGYDQVVVVARAVGDGGGEHVTTYGRDAAHCSVAARMGDFFKHKLMGWPVPEAAEPTREDALLSDIRMYLVGHRAGLPYTGDAYRIVGEFIEKLRDGPPPRTEAAAEGFYDAYWKKKDAAAAVPPDADYVLVPREPTAAMLEAGGDAEHMDAIDNALSFMQITRGVKYPWSSDRGDSPLENAYRAMIAAAPAVPSNVREQALEELVAAEDERAKLMEIHPAIRDNNAGWRDASAANVKRKAAALDQARRALKSATPDAGKGETK